MNKKNSAHCKHVPCNTLTHSTNEYFLNIKPNNSEAISAKTSYFLIGDGDIYFVLDGAPEFTPGF
jgi:hypothetical protein